MAKAKKCDICGGLYELYNNRTPARYPNYIELNSESFEGRARGVKTYDCCPKCMFEIAFLIEMIKAHGISEPAIIKEEVIEEYNLPDTKCQPTLYDILKENLEVSDGHN